MWWLMASASLGFLSLRLLALTLHPTPYPLNRTRYAQVGVMSLRLLVYFAQRHPHEYRAAIKRASMDYFDAGTAGGGFPTACAGVNLAFMLIDMLHLRRTAEQQQQGAGGAGGGARAGASPCHRSPRAHKAYAAVCALMLQVRGLMLLRAF